MLLALVVAAALWLYRRDPSPVEVGAQAGPEPGSTPTWKEPGGDGGCPDGYPVKVAASGIFHVPGGRSYDRTAPVRCYLDPATAEADGYRRAKA
jgi:hypothetical protein